MNLRSLVPFGNVGTRANPPANPFGSLQREIDRLFEDFTRGMDVLGQAQVNLVPSMDVVETDKEIVNKRVESEEGDKNKTDKSKDGGRNYHLSERSYGVFYRVLQMPSGVDPSKIQATMSNGVLKVTTPKPARIQAKKIEVKEAA